MYKYSGIRRHLVARKLGDDDDAFILDESVRESKRRSQN